MIYMMYQLHLIALNGVKAKNLSALQTFEASALRRNKNKSGRY